MTKNILTVDQLIDIFGKKKQTPDECILKLAMLGLSVNAKMLVNAIKTAVLFLPFQKEDIVQDETRSGIFFPERVHQLNSTIILGNLARIIKYTTEFNEALKSDTLIPRINKIAKRLLDRHMDRYRYSLISDLFENVAEIVDIIKDKDLSQPSKM